MVRYLMAYPAAFVVAVASFATLVAASLVWMRVQKYPDEAALMYFMMFGVVYLAYSSVTNIISVAVGQIVSIWSFDAYILVTVILSGLFAIWCIVAFHNQLNKGLGWLDYTAAGIYSVSNMAFMFMALRSLAGPKLG